MLMLSRKIVLSFLELYFKTFFHSLDVETIHCSNCEANHGTQIFTSDNSTYLIKTGLMASVTSRQGCLLLLNT
jgi:hypothetical protein